MKKSFRDLDVFRFAVDQCLEIYRATASFPRAEVYGLTAQMRSAAISVISNIAEGQGRLTPGEWRQFLSHARGSQHELEAQLIISSRLELISEELAAGLTAMIRRTGTALNGLIEYVRRLERHQSKS